MIEQVPYYRVAPQLQQLPASGDRDLGNTNTASINSILNKVSAQRLLPSPRTAHASAGRLHLAKADSNQRRAVVLDYVTLNSSQTNYTFQGDTTYYISGSCGSYGTNTFEGGAVLKFATNGSLSLIPGAGISPGINWKAGAYRPVIFTAKDDNSVGESIGTGNPVGYYGNPMLLLALFSSPASLNGLRMSYANIAIQSGGANCNLYNAQFVNCQNGLIMGGANLFLGNALFANTKSDLVSHGGSIMNVQNATFSISLFSRHPRQAALKGVSPA